MEQDYPFLSEFIPLQSTEYVRNTFPTFLEFMQAYFEFLEQPTEE
jgi:hypothetical protein